MIPARAARRSRILIPYPQILAEFSFSLHGSSVEQIRTIFRNSVPICRYNKRVIMIKVIASVVCAFAAMLMIILSLATTYWLQWVIVSHNRNITHYRGLFRHCWESRDNVTDELISAESDCSNDKHTLQDVLKSGEQLICQRLKMVTCVK